MIIDRPFQIASVLPTVSKLSPSSSIYYPKHIFTVRDADDIFRCLLQISDSFRLATNSQLPEVLWFRGQTSQDYPLLPTLIRSYCEKIREFSLPEFQRACIEQYLYSSRNAPELNAYNALSGNAQVEYLAEMQHYSYPTNLLDWSENMMIPLYFACKKTPKQKIMQHFTSFSHTYTIVYVTLSLGNFLITI